jgi:hypothetical protein
MTDIKTPDSKTPDSSSTGLRVLLRDIAGFAGSQYFTRFSTLIKGFIVAKVFGPEETGPGSISC